MTKLKDLPEGALLISDNGRKGLYSNDNAPIFIMELGDKKANVLWQGTSRYDAFMHPLTKKGKLEKNVDYVLPEDVNLCLQTFLDARSFMSSNSETFCLKVTNGASKETTNKYCVKMGDLDYLKEPKFTVQVTPYGDFLNEELIGNTPSYLRGTADEDQAALLNGHVLFIDDDSNDDRFKTHFTLEGIEDLSWSLPEYNPNNDSFTLVEGHRLPGFVKESNSRVDHLN